MSASVPYAFHALVKPTTGAICNLDCEYSFFLSKEALYPGGRFRMATAKEVEFHQCRLATLPRDRERFITTPDGEPGLNYLCAGYKAFFNHIDRPMRIMAAHIDRGDAAGLRHLFFACPDLLQVRSTGTREIGRYPAWRSPDGAVAVAGAPGIDVLPHARRRNRATGRRRTP